MSIHIPADAVNDSDDPLAESIRCLSFVSTRGEGLKAQLTDILERFHNDQRYRNDERYLKLWMRYADLTDDADKIFLLMKSKGIGTQLALFWAAWAYVLEMAESFSRAADTITEGRARAAVPVSLLEESHGSFHRRMLERMRIAHLDTRKCTSMDASRCIGATTLVKSSPARVTVHEPDCLSSSRSEQSKRAEAEHVSVGDAGGIGTTECAPRESNIKSAGGGLGVRKATGDQTRLKKRIRAHTLPTTSKDCDNATTTATLVRNPFSPDKRRRLTTNTTQYLRWASSCSIVHDARDDCLPKRWPRKTAKVGSRQPVSLAWKLGDQRLDVVGVLGEGALAIVFSCKVGEDQRNVAVKVERQDKTLSLPWECFITLQLSERLLLRRQRRIDGDDQPPLLVVNPEALFLYRDGCAMTMPLGSSGTLHDLVARYAKRGQAMPQLIAMHYTLEMLRFCRAMHSVSILHMDIKPDNWLLTRRLENESKRARGIGQAGSTEHSVSLIDFGRAIDLSIFPQNGSGTAFMGRCCASNFSCPAMTEGRAWKYDADLFALGSCVFFMLHGKYLEVSCVQDAGPASTGSGCRWRPVSRCKRYWEVDLWDNLFYELLNSDHLATGIADTDATLKRLEESLASYLIVYQRSRELQKCLRRQDNMFSNW